jgi:CelD/BcsL family acetyltransferase involved in cellulose biosynthesis
MEVVLRTPDDLSCDERTAWDAFQNGDPALASPYFSRAFMDAMAGIRRDVRVICARDAHGPAAFLPLHLGSFGHARPLGGPLGDHHGLIARPGCTIDLVDLLRRAGVGVYDFHGALGTQAAFKSSAAFTDGSWVMDLSKGYDAFVEARSAIEPKAFRNIRSRRRKIDEAGAVFRLRDDRDGVFERALKWKSAQYVASRHFDVFSVSWTRNLLSRLISDPQPGCAGLISSLEIGGELAAIHVGMRSADVLHYWFPVYDPEFSKFGPGLALLMEICHAVSEDGVSEVHLGPGDYDFKAHLSSWQMPLVSGYAGAGLPGLMRGAAAAIERSAEHLPLGRASHWPRKAFRRIDALTSFRAA